MTASTHQSPSVTASTVEEISEGLGEPDWLTEIRLEAFEAHDELPQPEVIHTPGRRWTNLDDVDPAALADPDQSASAKDRIEADGAEVLAWAEAVDQHPEVIEEHFGSVVDPQRDSFTALSTALFSAGTLVYVPSGQAAEDVTIRTSMGARSLFNYTLVVAEESASVTVLERQSSAATDATDRYYSGVVEAVAGENASIEYGTLQNLDSDTTALGVKAGEADRHGTIDWFEGNLGGGLVKASVETTLAGDGSETRIVGAFFGHDDQHVDVASRVDHEAEHTTADLVTRGVLDDRARSVYEGVQNVGREAWDTSSFQRENTLMLSDTSEADASPKLIINNHDTEASHSATVGQVDSEDLFYMTSRSIPDQAARDMLVEGFFEPVLDEVTLDELREDIRALIADRLETR
ncbi:Fe-S cluster assembly protein SufD [Halococcoides cellulosivorans]|uniref:Fe-S cluster assembly protein SufD n=1 Tax=Halococcoides cellulosivorans TaxID=1679096 RepID=A0A2R4X0Z0_9EURY|nr:Fe-S cluster assembly protein SufD [Halococcoides cellulosivorans]AWB27446.1 Fe-S cluster assembly protein SufD [Halococcoides cellulosivorans]